MQFHLFFLLCIFIIQSVAISCFTGSVLWVGIPLSISLGVLSYRNPEYGLKSLFCLLVLSGLLSNLLSSKPIISITILVLIGWLIGYQAYLRKNKLAVILHPLYKVFLVLIVGALISEIFSFWQYIGEIPNWTKEVVILYEGRRVNLAHAYGWIVLGFVIWSSGCFFTLYLYDFIRRFNNQSKLISWMSISLVGAIIIGIIQKYFNLHFVNQTLFINEFRINATFSDPNALAYFLIIAIPLLIAYWLSCKKNRFSELKILLIFALIFLMIQSGTRSALVCLVFMVLVMFLKKRKELIEKFKEKRKAGLFIFALFILVLSFTDNTGLKRIAETFYSENQREGFSYSFLYKDRLPYWKVGAYIFKENPLSGTGIGRYLLVLPDVLRKGRFYLHTPNEGACNLYIQIAAEMGIFVFLIMVWILIKTAIKAVKNIKSKEFYTFVVSMLFIFMLLLFNIGNQIVNLEVSLLFWYLVAVIWAQNAENQKGT
ncbi:MAG: O-antigen ligase family protein [bacterium]